MEVDTRLLELWCEIGEAIRAGDIQELFVVYGHAEPYTFGCAYRTSDLDDMLLQVRKEVTRIRSRREPAIN